MEIYKIICMNRKSIAEKFEISIETVRYYESVGLIKPKRDKFNGYRHYSEVEIIKIDMILRFKKFGFKLAEIKEFFNLLSMSRENMNDFSLFIDKKIYEIDNQIEGLKSIKNSLNSFKMKEDVKSCEIYSKLLEMP